uniref:Pentatricopeptide repeat-containing protein n=1 Tax=Ananas comosus var. bracteatus TaxID=296719 RepID=A0A6V7PLY6_ANACO|nr:unnamed protein product [Ananas comosus var. bracteatus]
MLRAHHRLPATAPNSSRLFSAIAALIHALDYSSGEEKEQPPPSSARDPPPSPPKLTSAHVLRTLRGLRNSPLVALAYFRDCENLGFRHDLSTYSEIVRLLSAPPGHKEKLVSLFLRLLNSPNACAAVAAVFGRLKRSSNGSTAPLAFAFDALIKAHAARRNARETVAIFRRIGGLGVSLPSGPATSF